MDVVRIEGAGPRLAGAVLCAVDGMGMCGSQGEDGEEKDRGLLEHLRRVESGVVIEWHVCCFGYLPFACRIALGHRETPKTPIRAVSVIMESSDLTERFNGTMGA